MRRLRFFVDLCVGRRLAEWLREQGHDVRSVEIPDPGDAEVLAEAFREDRVLVTIDKDFGKLIWAEQQGHAGLVRLPNLLTSERIALMAQVLDRHADDLAQRAVITAGTDKIRFSKPPDDEIHEGEIVYTVSPGGES